jgi:hypothetical protein
VRLGWLGYDVKGTPPNRPQATMTTLRAAGGWWPSSSTDYERTPEPPPDRIEAIGHRWARIGSPEGTT